MTRIGGLDLPDPPQNKIPEIDIQIVSAPVKASNRTLGEMKTIGIEVGRVRFVEKQVQWAPPSLVYRPSQAGGGEKLELQLEDTLIIFPPEDIIKVATDMQNKLRQASEDVADIDHQNLLDDLLKHSDDDDGTVQVLEGGVDDVKLEHFSGNTTSSILELIHFIKTNNLQDQKPWCVVWNLYRCMMVAAGRA